MTFRFVLQRETAWAPAGHEVGWQQLSLPSRSRRRPTRASRAAPTETDEAIVLAASGVRAAIARETGELVELSVGGRNAVVSGPQLQLWRAPTDNDGLPLLPHRGRGVLPRWLELGLDRLEQRLVAVCNKGGAVEVVREVSGRGRWDDVLHRQVFRLLASGGLLVENEVELGPELRDVPRIGVVLALEPGLERLEWYGRGPWESYSDRQASAVVGRFTSTVSEQYVPYILPQEHGHRSEARRLSLTDETGFGLEVEGRPTIGFTASHFTADDLSAACHTCDLEPRAEVVLSLDHAQRGLGTASCGPDTHPRHRLLEPAYQFGYVLTVVT